MTLDEAIQHCIDNENKELACGNGKCADEHKQLAQWLMELRKIKQGKYSSRGFEK